MKTQVYGSYNQFQFFMVFSFYFRKSIKFGLNSVARAIQHCQISSCLLAGDVEPEILVQHLVTLAVTHGIAVLIVPKLKKITRETVGFPCVALGIMVL